MVTQYEQGTQKKRKRQKRTTGRTKSATEEIQKTDPIPTKRDCQSSIPVNPWVNTGIDANIRTDNRLIGPARRPYDGWAWLLCRVLSFTILNLVTDTLNFEKRVREQRRTTPFRHHSVASVDRITPNILTITNQCLLQHQHLQQLNIIDAIYSLILLDFRGLSR